MKYLERLTGRKAKPKEQEPEGKSSDALLQSLKNLERVIATGHPQQQEIANLMGRMVRVDIAEQEAGLKERGRRYQMDLNYGLIAESGKKLAVKERENELVISAPEGEFTPEQVLAALSAAYPDYEVITFPPPYFPEGWAKTGYLGLRKPLAQNFGPEGPRALWWQIGGWNMSGLGFTVVTPEGQINRYWIDNKCLNVEVAMEAVNPAIPKALDGSHPAWCPIGIGTVPRDLPEFLQLKENLGNFWAKLLGPDRVKVLSLSPNGWDTIMTPSQAQKQPGYHSVPRETWINLKEGSRTTVCSHPTVDPGSWEEGKYVFILEENEYGLFHKRGGRYLLPYLFSKTRHYPQGLPAEDLQKEIEKRRVI